MPLVFPDLQTLHLALTSGIVPAAVSAGRARAALTAAGPIVVEPAVKLPRGTPEALAKLRVQVVKSSPAHLDLECCCWAQILPLQRDPTPPQPGSTTPILFELAEAARLPAIAGEILRLGNDRQSFRFLGEGRNTRALLRVVGPPYYSLLLALDRQGKLDAPRAYAERAANLWVELGWRHPLLDLIKVPDKKLLLLRPPHDWLFLDAGPLQDIYEIMEFEVPGATVAWQPVDSPARLEVPLSLAPGGTSEPPELWVLHENARASLDEFVRIADDALIARLSFAVAEQGENCTVIVRARPSRQPPPVLTPQLPALEFRPYLKLPNLYLPVGQRLQPPLRRDAVRKLLAVEADVLTWLYPHEDGSFTPECLPDLVFRPLTEWVDYVLYHDRVRLQAWMDSTLFDFERFVCRDEDRAKNPKPRERAPTGNRPPRVSGPAGGKPATVRTQTANLDMNDLEEEGAAALLLAKVKPDELARRQKELEEQFQQLEGPLDLPERQALWPRLAEVYSAQKNHADAGVCWLNALWEDNPEVQQWAQHWHRSLWKLDLGQTFTAQLDQMLAKETPSPGEVRQLASCVIAGHLTGRTEPVVLNRLNRLQQRLQEQQNQLPVRGVWLVSLALYKLTHGDVLMLARTRDRLLERLYQSGLQLEVDLPTFLRFSGGSSSERMRTFRDWLLELPGSVDAWLRRVHREATAPVEDTGAYAKLILAYGLARVGENERCLALLNHAHEVLSAENRKNLPVHRALLDAYSYRVKQVLAGKPGIGPLPAEWLEALKNVDKNDRYKIDRLRERSRLLEPEDKIDPFVRGMKREGLWKALLELADTTDLRQLEDRFEHLQRDYGGKTTDGVQGTKMIMQKALELAPRLGEAFALKHLPQLPALIENLPMPRDQVTLLERGLFAAGHFNQREQVAVLTATFARVIRGGLGEKVEDVVVGAVRECFRNLRKFGMRDEIHQLNREMHDAILRGERLPDLRKREDAVDSLCALLHVAANWLYFGAEDQAAPIIDEARHLLYKGKLNPIPQTRLACAYISTLGQAPVETALQGVKELLRELDRISDELFTKDCFSLSQLSVIEALVRAVVTEEFAIGNKARAWLDDDEYLVRRRIHQDLETALRGGK